MAKQNSKVSNGPRDRNEYGSEKGRPVYSAPRGREGSFVAPGGSLMYFNPVKRCLLLIFRAGDAASARKKNLPN